MRDAASSRELGCVLLSSGFVVATANYRCSDADSEDLLKLWFERTGKRDQICLATKFGVTKGPDGKPAMRSDPHYVREACERSLKRLGVKKIDLYYCHRVDKQTPIEETVAAMAELKKYTHPVSPTGILD
jgi:aryl-alcohol dehydrogenase-like predicted oxidoreductase